MTLVDTSVWVDFFRGIENEETNCLKLLLINGEVITGDLILTEILKGTKSEAQLLRVKSFFDALICFNLCGKEMAVATAKNYLTLKSKGRTVRKTIDEIIATFCIQNNIPLLHKDRDFEHYERHLRLRNALSL